DNLANCPTARPPQFLYVLEVAIPTRDPGTVESLRQGYRDLIWDAPEVPKQDIRSGADLDAVERMLVEKELPVSERLAPNEKA
ncbi:MAG: hypothetical protein ACUVXE_11280, partial [Anaerolineae bacterium]